MTKKEHLPLLRYLHTSHTVTKEDAHKVISQCEKSEINDWVSGLLDNKGGDAVLDATIQLAEEGQSNKFDLKQLLTVLEIRNRSDEMDLVKQTKQAIKLIHLIPSLEKYAKAKARAEAGESPRGPSATPTPSGPHVQSR